LSARCNRITWSALHLTIWPPSESDGLSESQLKAHVDPPFPKANK
jgi:hypothetical protein